MTKKDYIVIANAIAKSMVEVDDRKRDGGGRQVGSAEVFEVAMKFIADDLWADNTRFDGERFIEFINKKIAEYK